MSEIFNEETPDNGVQSDQQQQTAPSVTPEQVIPQELVDYVGEGKKYRTLQDVYKAFPNAQNHINTLEAEMTTLREELAKRKAAEELIEEMRQGTPKVEDNQPVGVDPEQLSKVVDNVLNQRLASQQQQNNAKQIVDVFKATYGEKAQDMYAKLAQENDMSIAELDNLAKTRPQIVIKLAGISPTKAPSSLGSRLQSDVTPGIQQLTEAPSAKVGKFATSREVARAWRAAGEVVKKELNLS